MKNKNIALYHRANFISSLTGSVGPAVEMIFAYNKGGGAVAVAALPFLRMLTSLIGPALAPILVPLITKKNAVLLQYVVFGAASFLTASLAYYGTLSLPLLYAISGFTSLVGGCLSPLSSAYMYDLVEKDHVDVPTAARTAFTLGRAVAFVPIILSPLLLSGTGTIDSNGVLALSNLLSAAGSIVSMLLMSKTVPVRNDSRLKKALLSDMVDSFAFIREMVATRKLVCFWSLAFVWNLFSVAIMYRPGFLAERFKTSPTDYLEYTFVGALSAAVFFQIFNKRPSNERAALGSLTCLSTLAIIQFCSLLISVVAKSFLSATIASAFSTTLWDLVALAMTVAVQQLGGSERQSEYFSLYFFLQKLALVIGLAVSIGADRFGCAGMMVINGTVGLVLTCGLGLLLRKER